MPLECFQLPEDREGEVRKLSQQEEGPQAQGWDRVTSSAQTWDSYALGVGGEGKGLFSPGQGLPGKNWNEE